MGRKITIQDEELTKPLSGRLGAKIRLSVVQYVKPSVLKANALNAKYFSTEAAESLKHLQEDIASRGILVPLIAKSDGTLLAGHNRLQIAHTLNLQDIPVQFVETPLSDEDERALVVKDNLLRRQLSVQQRMDLYKILYPDFEANFLNEETRVQTGRVKGGEYRTTIKQIAEDTGQNISTVKEQLREYRKKNEPQSRIETNETKNGYNLSISATSQKGQDSTALKTAKRALDSITKQAAIMPSTEREILYRLLKETVKNLRKK